MTEKTMPNTIEPAIAGMMAILPGLALAAVIALACLIFRSMTGLAVLNPIVLAILVGIAVQNLMPLPAQLRPGIAFAARPVLRFGIVVLGLQLTLDQVFDLGGAAVFIIAFVLIATFFAMRLMGRMLGVDSVLTDLIATGTAVCGASAVIAANAVRRGSEEDTAYAIACVSILGTAAMLLLPLIGDWLGMNAMAFGLWTGASVHEVAQVAAAAFQHSDAAGQYGTVSKLTRVVMLAPLVVLIAMTSGRADSGEGRRGPVVPLFVLGFIAMVLLNSFISLPDVVTRNAPLATSFLLATALAAIGMQINMRKLYLKGPRPFLLGLLGWVFIGVSSYALITLFGY